MANYLDLTPLDAAEMADLQIAYQTMSTDWIKKEMVELWTDLQAVDLTQRLVGGFEHPDQTRYRLLADELKRRGGDWPTEEAKRVIGWAGVATDFAAQHTDAAIAAIDAGLSKTAALVEEHEQAVTDAARETIIEVVDPRRTSGVDITGAALGAVVGAVVSRQLGKSGTTGAAVGGLAGYALARQQRAYWTFAQKVYRIVRGR